MELKINEAPFQVIDVKLLASNLTPTEVKIVGRKTPEGILDPMIVFMSNPFRWRRMSALFATNCNARDLYSKLVTDQMKFDDPTSAAIYCEANGKKVSLKSVYDQFDIDKAPIWGDGTNFLI